MKNNIGIVGAVGVVSLVLGLGGGYWYGKNHASSVPSTSRTGFAARGNFMGNGTGQNRAPGGSGMNRGNTLIGEVLSKDDKSLTVKLPDGGSKIIFYSETTLVTQSSTSTVNNLQVGNNVLINGTSNTDGTVTATNIQLNPRMFVPAMATTTRP